jgi:hypothetical protein
MTNFVFNNGLLTSDATSGRTNPAQVFGYASGGSGSNNVAVTYSTRAATGKFNKNDPGSTGFNATLNDAADWRVRVALAPGSNYLSNDPKNRLLAPLRNSNSALAGSYGVIFPYTPQISVTHTANYSQQKLTHNNYAQYFYENSEVQALNINGDFTVQSLDEGQYLLATIYFFRAVTKMFFGQDGSGRFGSLPAAGLPPPLVYLNGYGQYYLPNVPCVVTSFAHTMPADVDYVDIFDPRRDSNGSTRLPTTSQISLTLQPVYSRLSQNNYFSLSAFARGDLINRQTSGPATSFGSISSLNTGGYL